MKNQIILNFTAYSNTLVVDENILQQWTASTYAHCNIPHATVDVQIVDRQEGEYYNNVFRKKPGPTNVLSFPDDASGGEIILCDPVILAEAVTHDISPLGRYYQVYVHGLLHLMGHTHDHDHDTAIMEAIEEKLFETFELNQT